MRATGTHLDLDAPLALLLVVAHAAVARLIGPRRALPHLPGTARPALPAAASPPRPHAAPAGTAHTHINCEKLLWQLR